MDESSSWWSLLCMWIIPAFAFPPKAHYSTLGVRGHLNDFLRAVFGSGMRFGSQDSLRIFLIRKSTGNGQTKAPSNLALTSIHICIQKVWISFGWIAFTTCMPIQQKRIHARWRIALRYYFRGNVHITKQHFRAQLFRTSSKSFFDHQWM